jgi:ABC-2 type transport system permease protein
VSASRPLRAYAAVLRMAFRDEFARRGVVLGRAAFYVALLLVFSRLWATVLDRTDVDGASPTDLLWYLAITEWIVIALPLVHVPIERDVQTGDIAYLLPRPLSYLGTRVAEGVGQLFARMIVLGATGVVAARVLSGGFPSDPRGLLLALPLGVLAGVVGTVFLAAIGASALRLQDATPLSWVWQKLSFVLGGLILPLSIYPAWLRAFAEVTPWAAMLYGPGRTALAFDVPGAVATAGALLAWGACAALLAAAVFRSGLRVLDVNGG